MANSLKPSVFTPVKPEGFFCIIAALGNAHLPQSGYRAQCNHVVRQTVSQRASNKGWLRLELYSAKEGRPDETAKLTGRK